jgi:uncharacterized membrane protein
VLSTKGAGCDWRTCRHNRRSNSVAGADALRAPLTAALDGGNSMAELLDSLRSPTWWISVVVAGFIVNLLAAYAKPWTDRATAAISAVWSERSAAATRRCQQQIDQIRSSEHLETMTALEEIHCRIETIGLFFTGIVLIPIAFAAASKYVTLVLLLMALIAILLALHQQTKAFELHTLLQAVRKAREAERGA